MDPCACVVMENNPGLIAMVLVAVIAMVIFLRISWHSDKHTEMGIGYAVGECAGYPGHRDIEVGGTA